MKKNLVVSVIDTVSEKVMNLMVEENYMTLERNLDFVSKSIDGTAIRPEDVIIKVVGLLDVQTGEITSPDSVIVYSLADFCRKENDEEVTAEV